MRAHTTHVLSTAMTWAEHTVHTHERARSLESNRAEKEGRKNNKHIWENERLNATCIRQQSKPKSQSTYKISKSRREKSMRKKQKQKTENFRFIDGYSGLKTSYSIHATDVFSHSPSFHARAHTRTTFYSRRILIIQYLTRTQSQNRASEPHLPRARNRKMQRWKVENLSCISFIYLFSVYLDFKCVNTCAFFRMCTCACVVQFQTLCPFSALLASFLFDVLYLYLHFCMFFVVIFG